MGKKKKKSSLEGGAVNTRRHQASTSASALRQALAEEARAEGRRVPRNIDDELLDPLRSRRGRGRRAAARPRRAPPRDRPAPPRFQSAFYDYDFRNISVDAVYHTPIARRGRGVPRTELSDYLPGWDVTISGNHYFDFNLILDVMKEREGWYRMDNRTLAETIDRISENPVNELHTFYDDDGPQLYSIIYRLFHPTAPKPGKPYNLAHFRRAVQALDVPIQSVYAFPWFLIVYVVYTCCLCARDSYVLVRFYPHLPGPSHAVPMHPVYNADGNAVMIRPGKNFLERNQRAIKAIATRLLLYFTEVVDRELHGGTLRFQGSTDSGTSIMITDLMDDLVNEKVTLDIIFRAVHRPRQGYKWTEEIEQILRKGVGGCVLTVRNTNDNKCLLYCVVMGLMVKLKGNPRMFGVNKISLDPSEIYSKAMYMFAGETDPGAELIRKLARALFPPTYSAGDPHDPLFDFCENLDKKCEEMASISEFRNKFEEIEKTLIPNGICGIDVYGIDYNVNVHVFPLYITKQREKVIELLCMSPPNSEYAHYCLILNIESLMKRSGGKQFVSCTKCGLSFYHRRLLKEHRCKANVFPGTIFYDNNKGYHWSDSYSKEDTEMVEGVCPKCRLAFSDLFKFHYHEEHCLMKGITGYRHVQLVKYGDLNMEKPMLCGEEVVMEDEDKHLVARRVLYADFESYIDPESGQHRFMSYGIYDYRGDKYECGYTMEGFFRFILTLVYDTPQTHYYIYFHNAMGYDANFILRHVLSCPEYAAWTIKVIMKSMNRMQKLVFYLNDKDKDKKAIHICDSFQFLTLSLERIVDSIRKDNIHENYDNFERFFDVFSREYPDLTNEDFDHILRKNIFPYKFFTESSRLDTPIGEFLKIFEPREENVQYFSERIGVGDLAVQYADTKRVIERFGCESARDYHDIYLMCDVMQLADVFNRSMDILWDSHHIHLTKYIGMPSASWAAFLRHDPTMQIPLYTDTFYAEFFKGMIRGGITSAALRYAKADSMHSIVYFDVNGLYPYVMQGYKYPCGSFSFVPLNLEGDECVPKLMQMFEIFERESRGMCFCVDMSFPREVKERTDMYPFAPEHRMILREYFEDFEEKRLTPFLQKWSAANEGEQMNAFNGLVCTLYPKEKYNVHWRLLKFYIEHGVLIHRVRFGVGFQEGTYLQGYIRKNIEIRNTRDDELGKTLYKLLGNSVYGKTFESPFKRNTYEIVRDPTVLQGLLEEGNIGAVTPIDNLGWIVKLDGEDIILDKPTYIGAVVCEMSKLHMYQLLYDKLCPMFPGVPGDLGCQLVYTDTDSFILRLRHPPGVAADPKSLFDYIKQKDPTLLGKIGGQIKSETGEDDTIDEVIALRSKVYAYKTKNGHLGKRAKGTTKDAQERQLNWEAYQRVLESLTSFDTKNMQFVKDVFKVSTAIVTRRSLSVNDGKRFICEDGIHTHAFGYDTE